METPEIIENVAELVAIIIDSGMSDDVYFEPAHDLGITSGDLKSILEDPEQFAILIDTLSPILLEKLEFAADQLESEELRKEDEEDA